MIIGIGNDHGGVELKEKLVEYLKELGHQVINYGTNDKKSVDYPDIAKLVGNELIDKKMDLGILICGTGIGMSMAANKIKGIRAAHVGDVYSAKMSREHNDANILCLGARVIGDELAKMIVDTFLNSEFQGGRHLRRVKKIENV